MQLFRYYMKRLLKVAVKNNVRVKMIGEKSRFASDIIAGIRCPGRTDKGQYRIDIYNRSQLWKRGTRYVVQSLRLRRK